MCRAPQALGKDSRKLSKQVSKGQEMLQERVNCLLEHNITKAARKGCLVPSSSSKSEENNTRKLRLAKENK